MTAVHNEPASFKDDMLEGFVHAYDRYVQRVPGASGVMRRGGPLPGKVSVVIGGGSGHYPAFGGIVGPGFADGAVIGDVFTSPSAEQVYRVGKALDGGSGIVFSFGNYAGDVMNFGAAQERLRGDGIDVRTVLVTDDIASAAADDAPKRRGIAGDFSVFKVAGAAAERGDSLDEVERLARKTNAATATMGVAFGGCTLPGGGEPLFTVAPDRMELGLGIHGEPGIRSLDRLPARELAAVLVEPVLAERPGATAGRAAVLLNGLGSTKYEELFVLWKDIAPALREAGVVPVLPEVGELVTSLDMRGCSLTVTWLDEELEALWSAPADTPAFRRTGPAVLPGAGGSARTATPVRSSAFVRQTTPGAPTVLTLAEAAQSAPQRPTASAPSRRGAATAREALSAMLQAVLREESELGRLDAVAGDGDHGSGMVRGLRAATEASGAAEAADAGLRTVLRTAAAAWADRAGGTSGALWGALLDALADALGDTAVPTPARVAAGLRAGADAIGRLGGARLGDKTMLDALVPFCVTFTAAVADGRELPIAWAEAAPVATTAAADTAHLIPKVGRARPLAERSLGTPDPGAVSMALCLNAVTDVVARRCVTVPAVEVEGDEV
ncbi:dihydroxyacetone kinase family protein [Streptomyces sp. NPDC052236]|uniref:dihydroxyacetone kinase family protein n=1 Tax=Streptomyces sp. NPDC052236 TaxID=3365686 RepID=UPI0037CEEFCF